MKMKRLSTGCSSLDELLDGGIEYGSITEVYGEGGSGKTNLSLQLSRNTVRAGRKVVFIDTESVSPERLHQICTDENNDCDFDAVSSQIIFFTPYSLKEQSAAIQKAEKLLASGIDVGLIVLDSATIFYRVDLGNGNDNEPRKVLTRMITRILTMARRYDIPAFVTTQVYADPDADVLRPVGGTGMSHNAKTIVQLEQGEYGYRRAVVKKHRSIPKGKSVWFRITGLGIEDPEEGYEGLEVA